jgi:hypothetical protein
MKTCRGFDEDLAAALAGDPGADERLEAHARTCDRCRAEIEAYRRLLAETKSAADEARLVARTVDWDALAARTADRAFAPAADGRERAPRRGFPAAGFGWRPVFAGLLAGLAVGAVAMYLALRPPGPGRPEARAEAFRASPEFLENAELVIARRAALEYLKQSQFVLLDFVASGDPASGGRPVLDAGRARELLAKKRYLNAQLETSRMSQAKAICDQIELLFLELAGLSEDLPAAELDRVRRLIGERGFLLKIALVRKELESEV